MALKRILTNVWNGPFYLGPLTKPVTAIEAMMKICEVLWQFGFLVVIAVVISLLIELRHEIMRSF